MCEKNKNEFLDQLVQNRIANAIVKIESEKSKCPESYNRKKAIIKSFNDKLAAQGIKSKITVNNFSFNFWSKIYKKDGENIVTVNTPAEKALIEFRKNKQEKINKINKLVDNFYDAITIAENKSTTDQSLAKEFLNTIADI